MHYRMSSWSTSRSRRIGKAILPAFLLLLIAALPAWAQNGHVIGVVKDPQDGLIPGALVKFVDASTHKTRATRTNEQGEYLIVLAPAEYSLEISERGFKSVHVDGVKVKAGETVAQDVKLELGSSAQVVNVSASVLDNDVQTLTPQMLVGLPESSKADVTVITRDQIEALRPDTLWDVLQQAPGMEVTEQGRQHQEFTTSRGGNFRIVLDGVFLSQADRLIQSLPTDMVESITIVRDATALSIGPMTSFGSTTGGGNLGFVIIKTRRSSRRAEAGVVSSGGNFGSAMGHEYFGQKIGKIDYRVSGTYKNYEGPDGWNMQQHNGGLNVRGGYTSGSLNVDFMYYMSRGARNLEYGLILLPTTNNDGTLNYSKVGTLSTSTMNMNQLNSQLLGGRISKEWGAHNLTAFQYGYDKLDVQVTGVAQNSSEQSMDLKHTAVYGNHKITGGLQWLRYITPGTAPNFKRDDEAMLGLYVQDSYSLLADRLMLDGGVRADKKHFNNSLVTGSYIDKWQDANFSLGFGAAYKIDTPLTVTLRYGHSSFGLGRDQVSASGAELPDQQQNRYDLGFLTTVNQHFNPKLTFYAYKTKNQATTTGKSYIDAATGDEVDYVTTADIWTGGTELAISGRVFGPMKYSMGYSYLATDNETTNASMAHHLVNASLRHSWRRLSENISMVYAGPRNRSSSPMGVVYYQLGNYTRVDANVGYDFKLRDRTTKFSFFVRNLNDNLYATRYVTGAYRDPGRTYGVQMTMDFF